MARRLGQQYKLYVDNGSGVFNPLAGEQSLSIERSTQLIDQSVKGDGAYAVNAVGKSQLTISVGGGLIVPDANGIERVYTLANTRVASTVQIRLDPWASDDVLFEASMYVSNFSRGKDDNANATFSFQLTLAAAPTVDVLEPT